ncbi:L-histidine N(alpha)-methyltransferase [Exiguobacterium alkaliphilum]|uniref:L-histidine N(alpha)-methyltransferase n=1 Tax=Exiguobacterium alkaliphilum TaxID=1428684 RepID=UPI001BA4B972|nr:L-histidine N(alpha)-methyltransferase [Exiguobacterium alkaliphilum]QUE87915.1 L-histidine N(alpha)-methyltransferase [Exiguobacterium alkaliphilum]
MNRRLGNEITVQWQAPVTELVAGLIRHPKTISSKFLYDETGSRLFEDITRLPEYYQTRTETEILRSSVDTLRLFFDRPTTLVELGSGSSTKTKILLDEMNAIKAYVPIDISTDFLMETVRKLSQDYPHIDMAGVSADYTKSFEIPKLDTERTVVFFPGSTIGNFEPAAAVDFLRHIRTHLSNGDLLIIGVDRKKERLIIEAAYNDSSGVTSAFNKNLLTRINREYGCRIDETTFEHVSFYNDKAGRIEMHLQSMIDQTVELAGEIITFEEGETIHTENSYKFDMNDIETMSVKSGLQLKRVISDELNYFSVCIMEVVHQ